MDILASSIIIFELIELHASDDDWRIPCVGNVSWANTLDEEILVVLEIVFNISKVKSFVVDELLTISTEGDNDVSWNSDGRRDGGKLSVVEVFGREVISAISNCRLANALLSETFSMDEGVGTSLDGSSNRRNAADGGLTIVSENC